jgi:peptidoglycan/LPS O-acetylase OafA/YrhL
MLKSSVPETASARTPRSPEDAPDVAAADALPGVQDGADPGQPVPRDAPLASAPQESDHLAFIDGLRGLAALWVLLGHARLFVFGWDALPGPKGLPINLLSYLHYAVDVFIVLSGFCLALPAVRSGNTLRGGARRFFARRARRLLPPYYASVVLCLAINALVPLTLWARIQPAYLTREMPASVLLTHALLTQDIQPQNNLINGPFWSISVEWHIYFAFPLLLLMLRRFGPRGALLLAAIGSAILVTVRDHGYPLVSPHYLFLFGMGMCAASLSFDAAQAARISRAAWIIALSVTATILALAFWRYPIHDFKSCQTATEHDVLLDVLAGAATALSLGLLCRAGADPTANAVKGFLSSRPIRGLGLFSYSVYLVHLPILTLLFQFVSTRMAGYSPKWQFLLLTTLGTGIILGVCYLFFLVFERPFLNTRPSIEGRVKGP